MATQPESDQQEPTATARLNCTVVDGNFVEPCSGLEGLVDNHSSAFSKAKGITRWSYYKQCKPSRTFFGVKTKAYPGGLLFNFCPVCGADISAPFAREGEDA